MKAKPWLKYLIFVISIFLLIVLREYVDKLFLESYYRFKYPGVYFYLVISLIFGVCIGLFMGAEHLIKELKKEGTWKINLPKLIIVGLPSLYFSLSNIWFASSNQFIHKIIASPSLYLFKYGLGFISLFQMVLGYVVITSFFKEQE